jgi:hypothetical protein
VAVHRVTRTSTQLDSRLWVEDVPVAKDGRYLIGGLPVGTWPSISAPTTDLMSLFYKNSATMAAATDVS